MKEGKLPVRYLGVPSISSRLSSADCGVLLERITRCIDSWLCRNLSYTGRSFNFSLLCYTICKSTGLAFLSFLRRL
jgi:hypothetical protein